MEHHRPGVDHRTALVRREPGRDVRHQLGVLDRERSLEHALQREQPVAVAGEGLQDVGGEGRDHLADPVAPTGAEPHHRCLGADDGHPLLDGVGLVELRLRRAGARVACDQGGVAGHVVQDAEGVRDQGPAGRLLGGRPQDRQGVGAPMEQVQGKSPGRGEEPRLWRLLCQQFEGPHLPVHAGQVEHLPGERQPPHMGLQPAVRVRQVCGGVPEPDRPGPPALELVGAPVRGQRGIERIGQQHGLGVGSDDREGFLGERACSAGLPRVGPAAGEGCGET